MQRGHSKQCPYKRKCHPIKKLLVAAGEAGAAVDDQGVAGDVIRFVASQEYKGVGALVRGAEFPQRDRGLGAGAEFRIGFVAHFREAGHDDSGSDVIDEDAVDREFLGHEFGEHFHAGLGHAVAASFRPRQVLAPGAGEEDFAADTPLASRPGERSLFGHDPGRGLADVEVSGKVQIEVGLPLVGADVQERAVFHHGRVADDHVDPGMFFQDLGEHVVDGLPPAGVAGNVLNGPRPGLGLTGDFGTFFRIFNIGHDYGGTQPAAFLASGPADVPAGRGNDDHFSLQAFQSMLL